MKNKQITATALAVLMAASLSGPVYAEGPSGKEPSEGIAVGGPSGVSEEEAALAAALQDNRMEYGELAGRIEYFNMDYKKMNTAMVSGVVNSDAARALAEEADSLMEDARDLKTSDMDAETRALYESYKKSAKELRKAAQKTSNAEIPYSIQTELRRMKVQLTRVAQGLMTNYNKMLIQQETLNKQIELTQAQLQMTERMVGLGMKSQEDVLSATETMKRAEDGAAQINAGLQGIRQNLLILTGWNYDADVAIDPVPTSDLTRIASMNPEADLNGAIGTNYELQSVRKASAVGSVNRGVKKRNIELQEQQLASTLQQLYATVISKKQAYDAALSDFEAASQNMRIAETKNAMGMLGRLEYLAEESAYLTAKAAKETADIDLFTAMENYDWALKGSVSSGGN